MKKEKFENPGKKKYDLTPEEIIEAKENCFILLGKTGTGKTSLLNLIYGDEIGKIGFGSKSETKESSYYCIKEEINSKKVCFSIIDTPGLYDSDGRENDENMKNSTKDLIAKENMKIKGILFLSNFQNERFDYSEINSLIQYNSFFPLKNFWQHVILIFTHYYGDPDGDSKEEIREKANKNLSLIFSQLMERIKEVSTPVKFSELEKLYINTHSKIKTEKQKKDNEVYKNIIFEKIKKFMELEPMYNKLCFFDFKNIEVEKYKGYVFNAQLELFLDEKNNIINKIFEIKDYSPKDNIGEENQIEVTMIDCEIDNNGNLKKKKSIKKGSIKDFKLSIYGGSAILISCLGGIFIPLIGLYGIIGVIGGTAIVVKNLFDVINKKIDMEEKRIKLEKEMNIKDLVENEIIKSIENNKIII